MILFNRETPSTAYIKAFDQTIEDGVAALTQPITRQLLGRRAIILTTIIENASMCIPEQVSNTTLSIESGESIVIVPYLRPTDSAVINLPASEEPNPKKAKRTLKAPKTGSALFLPNMRPLVMISPSVIHNPNPVVRGEVIVHEADHCEYITISHADSFDDRRYDHATATEKSAYASSYAIMHETIGDRLDRKISIIQDNILGEQPYFKGVRIPSSKPRQLPESAGDIISLAYAITNILGLPTDRHINPMYVSPTYFEVFAYYQNGLI